MSLSQTYAICCHRKSPSKTIPRNKHFWLCIKDNTFCIKLMRAGLLGEALSSNLAGSVLIVSSTLASIATGIPLPVLPAPLVSAGGLALALESRQIQDYMLFVAGGLTTSAWFILHHFWFLDVKLQVRSNILAEQDSVCVVKFPRLSIRIPWQSLILLTAQWSYLQCSAAHHILSLLSVNINIFYRGVGD